jgi:dipeptide/tripeptide permease
MENTPTPAPVNDKFPPVFWFANATELFERAAYYSMAAFVVIYLGQLGLGTYWPAILNTLLWFLVYFLPILSGTVADQIGYRKALLAAVALLTSGYLLMGAPVWLGGAKLSPTIERQVTAGAGVVIPVIAGIVLIGFGASIVKPCVLGTTQKTAGSRATLAYALFYLIVNIGALFGRGVAFFVRTRPGAQLVSIFAVGAAMAALALVIVLPFYKGPRRPRAPARPASRNAPSAKFSSASSPSSPTCVSSSSCWSPAPSTSCTTSSTSCCRST